MTNVHVPLEVAQAAYRFMEATGEHHGSELEGLFRVLDAHPRIGACRECGHPSGEHESERLGGCTRCGCSEWARPAP